MPVSDSVAAVPRVAAVLVTRDGAEWLPSVLATLEGQRYPALDIVAVDNASSDRSAELLAARLPPEAILRLPRNAGFGRAVAAALTRFETVAEADLVLLVHDDLVLAPRALARMAKALLDDERVGIVGPKLRDWSGERVLQEVGMTIDRLGRSESLLEPAELDQGQHDAQREVLYVSTAGMLLRREVFRQVGGFDARFPLFRDDLDLCWRAWLAGHRVEVVPRAIGYHVAAASRHARPAGRGRAWEARYLAERHSIATLLKNYGWRHLLWVLPLVAFLGVVKVIGFTATRRFGDALATIAAWTWNLGQLPRTLRRRRRAQARREVADPELLRLFAPGLPRLRSYGEALGSWLAGGSTRALIDETDGAAERIEDLSGLRSLLRSIRTRPGLSTGLLLAALYLVGMIPLLGPGQILGGQVAAWPEQATEFLRAYAHPWNGEPLAAAGFASPAQALLGLTALAGLGSAWLAQRLVVLGVLPLAWLLALRAGRLVTIRKGPQALGATLYVVSPVVLGALATGRLGVAIVAALLPGLVLVGVRAADPGVPATAGWRAAALLTLGLATAGAAELSLLGVIASLYALLLVAAALRSAGRLGALLRVSTAGAVAAALLAPWLAEVIRAGWSTLAAPVAQQSLPLWRALGLAPDVLAGASPLGAGMTVALGVAVAAGALLVGMSARPWAVVGLLAAWLASALAAWGVAAAGVPGLWPPALLLPGVVAHACLGVVAARWLSGGLTSHAFGLRQVATGAVALVLGAGLVVGVLRVGTGPWDSLRLDPELLPAFVTADVEQVGPYRVLLLSQDANAAGGVRWDVVEATGPSMRGYGTLTHQGMLDHLDSAVAAVVGGVDPGGGPALGLAGVRYVVAPGAGATPALVAAVANQPALDPVPAGETRVWRVRTWIPRASVLPSADALALVAGQEPPAKVASGAVPLAASGDAAYAGHLPAGHGGLLVVSEGTDGGWSATANGRRLPRIELGPLIAFEAPGEATNLRVSFEPVRVHRLVVALQALLALLVLSVALRPPGTSGQRQEAKRGVLPAELEADADAEPGAEPEPDAEPAVRVRGGGDDPEAT
jgi:GT2 family glycosyltransferase